MRQSHYQRLSTLGGFHLRQLAINVFNALNRTDNDDTWIDEVKSLFADIDTAELLTEEGESYCGFIENINRESIKTIEDVEEKLILFGMAIDRRNGQKIYS